MSTLELQPTVNLIRTVQQQQIEINDLRKKLKESEEILVKFIGKFVLQEDIRPSQDSKRITVFCNSHCPTTQPGCVPMRCHAKTKAGNQCKRTVFVQESI